MSSVEVEVITLPVIAITNGGPVFKHYLDFEKRLSSYDPAMRDTFPPFTTMAKAGSFSTGFHDIVVCF